MNRNDHHDVTETRSRDWLTMTDPGEFDTALRETQAALFPEPSRVPGEVPLFGDAFGQDL